MTENERVKYLREVALPSRKGKRISQDAFVDGLGIKKSALSLIESGRNSLTDSVRLLICSKYHVREDWLKNGDGEIFDPDPESELDALCDRYGLEEGSRAFIKEFAELPDNERKIILKYIEKVCASLRGEEPAAASASDQGTREQLHSDLDKELALQKGQEGKSTGFGSTAV